MSTVLMPSTFANIPKFPFFSSRQFSYFPKSFIFSGQIFPNKWWLPFLLTEFLNFRTEFPNFLTDYPNYPIFLTDFPNFLSGFPN